MARIEQNFDLSKHIESREQVPANMNISPFQELICPNPAQDDFFILLNDLRDGV